MGAHSSATAVTRITDPGLSDTEGREGSEGQKELTHSFPALRALFALRVQELDYAEEF